MCRAQGSEGHKVSCLDNIVSSSLVLLLFLVRILLAPSSCWVPVPPAFQLSSPSLARPQETRKEERQRERGRERKRRLHSNGYAGTETSPSGRRVN